MLLKCAAVLGLYVEHSTHALAGVFVMAYASNVKYMYTSISDHIVDCSEFMWGIYSDIVALYLHMN